MGGEKEKNHHEREAILNKKSKKEEVKCEE